MAVPVLSALVYCSLKSHNTFSFIMCIGGGHCLNHGDNELSMKRHNVKLDVAKSVDDSLFG